jgi:hypothetical protein
MTAGLRTLPDYIIVGGKRCGSTSLQAWLATHPAVVASHSGKGTHFFDENYGKGLAWFRGHYPLDVTMHARANRYGGRAVTGEASPYYCVHPSAFDRIAEHLPQVKLVFVVREPVDRAYSHWRYEVRRGVETLDVHAALDAESDRLRGEEERMREDPSYVSWNHRHFSYVMRGQYADQLDRCLRRFPREQVLVLGFSDVFGGGTHSMTRLCDFLDIEWAATPMPRKESGGDGGAVPDDVRARLEPVFAASNQRLREEFGVAFS